MMAHRFIHLSKRPVTILEVVIALALTATILSTLTFFYHQISKIDATTEKIITENFQLRYVETRLAEVIPRTIEVGQRNRDFVFFSVENDNLTKYGCQSLIFTFDNQISLDKQFANNVVGRLFVDPEGNLTLAYWPSPQRWIPLELPPIKKEVLLENVDSLSFEFYVAPRNEAPKKEEKKKEEKKEEQPPSKVSRRGKAPEKVEEPVKETQEEEEKGSVVLPEPEGAWRTQPWLIEYNQLPAMIRITVQQKNQEKPTIYAFPLPNTKSHIVYPL